MPTKPLALGLVRAPRYATSAERSRVRIQVGSLAANEGYALAEIFEVVGEPVRDTAALASLQDLALKCEAATLITAGDVQIPGLTRLLGKTGMTAQPATLPKTRARLT